MWASIALRLLETWLSYSVLFTGGSEWRFEWVGFINSLAVAVAAAAVAGPSAPRADDIDVRRTIGAGKYRALGCRIIQPPSVPSSLSPPVPPSRGNVTLKNAAAARLTAMMKPKYNLPFSTYLSVSLCVSVSVCSYLSWSLCLSVSVSLFFPLPPSLSPGWIALFHSAGSGGPE